MPAFMAALAVGFTRVRKTGTNAGPINAAPIPIANPATALPLKPLKIAIQMLPLISVKCLGWRVRLVDTIDKMRAAPSFGDEVEYPLTCFEICRESKMSVLSKKRARSAPKIIFNERSTAPKPATTRVAKSPLARLSIAAMMVTQPGLENANAKTRLWFQVLRSNFK
jgi:hypothetical protein